MVFVVMMSVRMLAMRAEVLKGAPSVGGLGQVPACSGENLLAPLGAAQRRARRPPVHARRRRLREIAHRRSPYHPRRAGSTRVDGRVPC